MPVLMRVLDSGNLPPAVQVFSRYVFAFFAALIYFSVIRREKFAITKKDIPLILITTVFGYSLMSLFLTYAVLMTHIGNALFLFNSYIIITSILAYIFLKEKINTYNLISIIIIIFSLLLLFQPNSLPTWKLGGAFAILAALSQSVYLIVRKKLKSYSAGLMMLLNTFSGVIVVGFLGAIIENRFYTDGALIKISPAIWLVTALFGVINFFAWLTMPKGFEYFKATTGSLILLSELVFGIIISLIFFKEIPTLFAILGGIMVVLAISISVIKSES